MTFAKSINQEQALDLITQQVTKIKLPTEFIPLENALGRVIAAVVSAPINVPAFDCSRMDGYAVNLEHMKSALSGDTGDPPEYELAIGHAIHAQAQTRPVKCENLAVPIMTGGVIPIDADGIIIKENTRMKHGRLYFKELPTKGQHIRRAGSDLLHGYKVIEAGTALKSAHIGLLASLGISEVQVCIQPVVALMMTGDELIQPGKPCLPGQTYDANAMMLKGLLSQMGCQVTLLDYLQDSEKAIEQRFKTLSDENYHIIISVGGVSMGDKDHIAACIANVGEIVFHKLKVKPGFPMLFGRLAEAVFFGLPGNPVSAYTTLCQYVFPAIKALLNQDNIMTVWPAALSHDMQKNHDRKEFMRANYVVLNGGQLQVSTCNGQQSSRIGSLVEANCFMVLDEGIHKYKARDVVHIQPFTQFVN